jgi:hypothetical protein
MTQITFTTHSTNSYVTREINVCPEKKLKEYLLERGSYSGSLFCHFDKTPLSRYQFNAVLKKALAYSNIPGLSKPFIPYWNDHPSIFFLDKHLFPFVKG